MDSFLKDTAQKINQKYSNEIHQICFVFPNKRTKIFFRKAYAETINRTDFAPDMKEIRFIINGFTKLTEPDRLSMLFDIYNIFSDIVKEKPNIQKYDFDSFYRLSEIILNDFNEIDNWLIDVNKIFRDIRDIQEINEQFSDFEPELKDILRNYCLNFTEEKSSAEKEKFIQFWNILPQIYNKFTRQLLNNNTAYNGLMYRVMCQMIDNNSINISKYKKYIFVGFNALNNAELKLFKYLKDNDKAEFYWDTDIYYQNDSQKQEAGDFIRKNFKNLDINDYEIPDNFSKQKYIELIGVPQRVGQAKIIQEIFDNYDVKNSQNETAIILADENLLFPVLHSLPQYIDTINVTMGYPLASTAIFDIIKQFIKLKVEYFQKNSGLYYHKHISTILRHPDVWEYDNHSAAKLIEIIKQKNTQYIEPQILLNTGNELFSYIFKPLESENTVDKMLTALLNILFLIFKKNNPDVEIDKQNIENEYIYLAYLRIKKFQELLKQKNTKLSLKIAGDLLLQILNTEQIPFAGKAQKGLQLMGVMESRNLDFKNVILLAVNEGNLPSVSRKPSFFGQSIRKVFGLPEIQYQDSVFAYLFYRILQRAQNITIVYNNIVSDSNSREKSRFILQLLYESGKNIVEKQFAETLTTSQKHNIEVENTPETIKALENYFYKENQFNKSLSASALNTYMDCSLKFYFRYIAKIKQSQEVEEDISSTAFGIILHNALDILYSQLIEEKQNNLIEKNDFIKLNKNIDKAIIDSFKEYYNDNNDEYIFQNNQIIIKEVIKKYIVNILKIDKKYSPFEIISLEKNKNNSRTIQIEVNGQKKIISLAGIIDRVDKKDGIYRIIDYKTGQSDKIFKSVDDMFDIENQNRKSQVFQTFFYSYLFLNLKPAENNAVVPAIYDVRSMADKNFSPLFIFDKTTLNSAEFFNLLPVFEENLKTLLTKIFDQRNNFCTTSIPQKCDYCEYNVICKA